MQGLFIWVLKKLIHLARVCRNAKSVRQSVIWRWQMKTFRGSPNGTSLSLGLTQFSGSLTYSVDLTITLKVLQVRTDMPSEDYDWNFARGSPNKLFFPLGWHSSPIIPITQSTFYFFVWLFLLCEGVISPSPYFSPLVFRKI